MASEVVTSSLPPSTRSSALTAVGDGNQRTNHQPHRTAAAAAAKVHVTYYDRSDHANLAPKHSRSVVIQSSAAATAELDERPSPTSSLPAMSRDPLTISQPALRTGTGAPGRGESALRGQLKQYRGGDDAGVARDDVNGGEENFDSGFVLSPQTLMTASGVKDLKLLTFLELRIDSKEQGLNNFGSYLPNLKQLKLNGGHVTSMRDLGSGFSTLEVLYIADCQLATLDGLTMMVKLRELYAAFNFIDHLDAICACEELRVVDFECNLLERIADIAFLAMCPYLESVTLVGNPCSTRPEPTGPEPTPGYDYRATVRQFMPGLTMLDDTPLGSAKPGELATLQRRGGGSAGHHRRPLSAMSSVRCGPPAGGRGGPGPSPSRPRSSAAARSRSSLGGRSLSSMSGPIAAADELDEDEEEEEEQEVVTQKDNVVNLGGSVVQGNLARALRRGTRKPPQDQQQRQQQHQPAKPSTSTDEKVAASSKHTAASGDGSRVCQGAMEASRMAPAPVSTAGSIVTATAHVSTAGAIVTPVIVDVDRQRSAIFDELRQWRDTFSQGQDLLDRTNQLSPVRDAAQTDLQDGEVPGPSTPRSGRRAKARSVSVDMPSSGQDPTSTGSNSSKSHMPASSSGRRQLPQVPGADGHFPPAAPTPPKGPRPANRRLRPITARASLQHIAMPMPEPGPRVARRGGGGGAIVVNAPARQRARKVEPFVHASTEEPAALRPLLRRPGWEHRPMTAVQKQSGYVP